MIAFSPKTPAEVVALSFDFAALLAAGETVSSASYALSVLAGVDADFAAMLTGTEVISDGIVTRLVRAGLDGVHYRLICTITTSQGQTLQLAGVLPVKVQS